MKTHKTICGAVLLVLASGVAAFSQNSATPFVPMVFWEANAEKGVVLSAPSEMEIVDSQGTKYGIIRSTEAVINAIISPDGGEIVYTTATGIWLVMIETGKRSLVAAKTCDYLRWGENGASLIFGVYEKAESAKGATFSLKLFRVGSDGQNLRQIYP